MLWVLIRSALARLMSTHNICFYGEIRKIIPELSPNTPSKQFLCYQTCCLEGVHHSLFITRLLGSKLNNGDHYFYIIYTFCLDRAVFGSSFKGQNMLSDHITRTYLYYFDPLKPHFYIVKLGFTGVYIIFLISAQNIDCGYSLEPPHPSAQNIDCGYSLEPPH